MGSNNEKELVAVNQTLEEEQATEEMWKYIFGFTEMAVLKCAVELGIPDALEARGGAMTVQELTSALGCKNSSALARVMRFLCNRGIFRSPPSEEGITPRYQQTALSRRFRRSGTGDSVTALLLLESSPVMLSPWLALTGFVASSENNNNNINNINYRPFEVTHGKNVWEYAAGDPGHSRLINEALACFARQTVGAMVPIFEEVFGGARSVVDVGGGNGTIMKMVVKACPWLHAINFDLPHVVTDSRDSDRLHHVAGDMFQSVPKADVAFISSVLHDWSDNECIRILKNCRESIPKEKGKVVLLEVVLETDERKLDNNKNNNRKLKDVGLFLDMVMMAHTTTGKERTFDEWTYVLGQAGFGPPTVHSIAAVQSVIEAFPA